MRLDLQGLRVAPSADFHHSEITNSPARIGNSTLLGTRPSSGAVGQPFADIGALAGSLSLAVSVPTMLVGFTRYSREQSFSVLRANGGFVLAVAVGSIVGTFIGGLFLLAQWHRTEA